MTDPFADRRQKRIREQLRDAVDEAKAADATLERDKQRRSVQQFLQIDEVEALLAHVDDLEEREYDRYEDARSRD